MNWSTPIPLLFQESKPANYRGNETAVESAALPFPIQQAEISAGNDLFTPQTIVGFFLGKNLFENT
jgi:hypothetical protein